MSNEDVEGSHVQPMHQKPVIDAGRVQRDYLDLCYSEKPPIERKLIRESLVVDVASLSRGHRRSPQQQELLEAAASPTHHADRRMARQFS